MSERTDILKLALLNLCDLLTEEQIEELIRAGEDMLD